MGYLDDLMKKAEGFRWNEGPEIPKPEQEQAVVADEFDHAGYEDLHDTLPALRKTIRSVQDEFDYVAPAYEDLYHLLHGGDPQFRDYRAMKDGYDANHQMLSAMSKTDEFSELRKETAYDEYATAFTMLSMEDEVRDAFKRTKEAREARAQAMEAAKAAQEALRQAIQQAQQAQNPLPPGVAGPQPMPGNEAGQQLQQAIDNTGAAQQALDAAQAAQQQAAQEAGQTIAQAAAQAGQDLKEQEEAAAAYGVNDGQLQQMNFEERQALTRDLNQGRMKMLADLIGQWRAHADAERRRKVVTVPSEIFDVELGNDLTKMIAGEFTALAIPELEDLFWMRYANHELMQWRQRGPEHLGKGPILVVCDESGSMGSGVDAKGNTREMWSKAITMALADQARRGKRDFTYIGFSSVRQQWRLDFPGGETPIEKVKQFVSHFFQGGTEYTTPLTMAMEVCQAAADEGRKMPDIVFITDDDCSVPPEFVEKFREARDALGITSYGIQIGGSALRNTMSQLCDKTIDLSQVNSNPEGMTELFRTI